MSRVSPDQLPPVLPRVIEDLSIGRCHIVLDQLRMAIADDPSQVIVLMAHRDETPIAVAVALHHENPGAPSSSATVLHAASLEPIADDHHESVSAALANAIDQTLGGCGVTFVQWATDVQSDAVAPQWCGQLGFERVADLEYLSGQLPTDAGSDGQASSWLRPIDWLDPTQALKQFSRLVDATYVETLDCPRMTDFRDAEQTLAGYRNSLAFDPSLWFEVSDPNSDRQTPIGCVILSDHSPQRRRSGASSGDIRAAASPAQFDAGEGQERGGDSQKGGPIELVYMGLLPSARRAGLGRRMLAEAMDVAARRSASQMIMAVDQANPPARRIYHDAGFVPLLTESVWVKSLTEPSKR